MADSSRPVALVTGSARRIGAAIARTLHAAGYDIVLHQRRETPELAELAASLESVRPESILVATADLADDNAVQKLPLRCVERFGRLDVLVNNASSFYNTPLAEVTARDWADLFAANARGPLFLAQAAASELASRRGAMINLLDINAGNPARGYSVYGMAKSALATMTRALAVELAPNVRVNGVALGAILWPHSDSPPSDAALQTRREKLDATPLQRLGTVEEVAATVLFLARDATYCTGVILPVDGGARLV